MFDAAGVHDAARVHDWWTMLSKVLGALKRISFFEAAADEASEQPIRIISDEGVRGSFAST